jgi:hypothetical protein
VSGSSVVGCKNDARDAQCSPDEGDPSESSLCIYAGKGNGPLVGESACPPVEGDVPAECPSFYDVKEVLDHAEQGNCSWPGCHGGAALTAQNQIFLPLGDAQTFYESLVAEQGSVGRPYVVADDPETDENESLASWMVCNLLGQPGGGFPMPPPGGMPDPEDVEIVRDWILCGAPEPEPCVADEADPACLVCSKEVCCGAIQQCLADPECAPCVACLQTNPDFLSCTAECDADIPRADALRGCAGALCGEELCPQEPDE